MSLIHCCLSTGKSTSYVFSNAFQFHVDTCLILFCFRDTVLTPELLQKWYESRAYQIEKNSCMVDNALQLIKIAKSHNIDGLENLLLDLETLNDLIYKVYLEDLSLDELQKLTNLEKIKLLMSQTTEKSFVDDIKNFVLPFIKRRHRYLVHGMFYTTFLLKPLSDLLEFSGWRIAEALI